MRTATAGMHPCQRRRRTWRCSGGERPAATLFHLISQQTALLMLVCRVCSHVMNELLETERAYVEELLCVLQVFAEPTDQLLVLISSQFEMSSFYFVIRGMLQRWITPR